MQILRNNSSYPGFGQGVRVFCKQVSVTDNAGAVTYVMETGCANIFFAKGINASGTVLQGTVAASTTYPGSKKVTFTCTSNLVSQLLVIGSTEQTGNTSTVGNVTITDDLTLS